MTLSPALRETYASIGPSVVLETLELIHHTFPSSFRIVRDNTEWDLTLENSGPTVTFQALSFQVVQPPQNEKGTPSLSIVIDNVDQQMIELLEDTQDGTNTPIEVIYRIYLDTATDTPQNDPPLRLSLFNVSVDKNRVSGVARRDDIINRRFPGQVYDRRFISLFVT